MWTTRPIFSSGSRSKQQHSDHFDLNVPVQIAVEEYVVCCRWRTADVDRITTLLLYHNR